MLRTMSATRTELPGEGTAEGERLREASLAFESGDFATVRRLAATLARSGDPDVARAARELGQRVGVDPVAVAAFVLCLAFFGLVVQRYVFGG